MRIARTCTDVCRMSGRTPACREIAPAAPRFVAALFGEVDVDPAGEQVLQVPLALPVAKQDERVRHEEHSARPVVSGPDMGATE